MLDISGPASRAMNEENGVFGAYGQYAASSNSNIVTRLSRIGGEYVSSWARMAEVRPGGTAAPIQSNTGPCDGGGSYPLRLSAGGNCGVSLRIQGPADEPGAYKPWYFSIATSNGENAPGIAYPDAAGLSAGGADWAIDWASRNAPVHTVGQPFYGSTWGGVFTTGDYRYPMFDYFRLSFVEVSKSVTPIAVCLIARSCSRLIKPVILDRGTI